MTTEKALAILRQKQGEWVCHNDVHDVLEECIKEIIAEPTTSQWLRCHEGPQLLGFKIVNGVVEYEDGAMRAASSAEILLWVWTEWAIKEFQKLRAERTGAPHD